MLIRRLAAALTPLTFLLCSCAVPSGSSGGSQSSVPASSPGIEHTDALIYEGTGTWKSEVDSLKATLYAHQATYQTIDEGGLDSISLAELAHFKLIIFSGGDAPTIVRNMREETHEKLRIAVQEEGLNYLGFCAGAWMAVAPAPDPGKDVSYGLGVVAGPLLEQNYLYKQGREFAIARASFPGGHQRDLLWYGGPITPNIPGGVIAKYPDGTPAITQIRSGRGFVIVSGLHPTADHSILIALGLRNPEAIAPELTWQMIDSAIHQRPMVAF